MIRMIAVIGCSCICLYSFGQQKGRGGRVDTVGRFERWRNSNIFQFFRNSITKGRPDSTTVVVPTALNTKSESPFKPYEGRIIRHIYIRGYGFEQTFTDTSQRLAYKGTQLLNHLHRKTRDWVIRDNLFIKENMPVNAFKLADNERLIRSLNFIQDARILVTDLPDNPDSVDLVVVVKDLFSISGAVGSLGVGIGQPAGIRANASEANFLGMGQRVQGGINLEQNRHPSFGGALLYSKSNIAGSFVNATASYTTINSDLYPAQPDEKAWFVRLDRPLYSPYAHLAGGFTIGKFQDFNVYNFVDSDFYKYNYRTHDGWIGWNLGSDKFLSNTAVRDRRFVAFRYFRNDFDSVPYQVGNTFNFRFNDREAALTSFTFFRQDFYKTNYIYGFGTTEDLPVGYNIALTSGWYRQLYLNRWYSGVDANGYTTTKRGAFFQFFLRSGVFMYQGQAQDASILVGTSYYSPLFLFPNLKIRQYINFSYTRQFNRVGIDPLTIDNVFGLRYFSGDSTYGDQRITLHSETTFFTNYKFLGFKFAPFVFGDLSLLTPQGEGISKSNLYDGIGTGIRTRNENLVFNTIELRVVYFPHTTQQNEHSFKLVFTTGLQFRFNNTYVRQPDVVFLNTDGLNSIY